MKFLHVLMDLGGLEDGIALFGEKMKESFKSMEICWGKRGGNLQTDGSLWAKEEGTFKSREVFVKKRRKPSNQGKFLSKREENLKIKGSFRQK